MHKQFDPPPFQPTFRPSNTFFSDLSFLLNCSPLGISVAVTAPAVFRYTGAACGDRHLRAAEIFGADISSRPRTDEAAGALLAEQITKFLEGLGVPNGLKALGYTSADIPALVKGTLPQHRVTKLAPLTTGEQELNRIFEDAMVNY